MGIPRMRTAKEAIAMLKEQDSETSITERAIRTMINSGKIPYICVGRKKLINYDLLLDILSNETVKIGTSSEEYGKIRTIANIWQVAFDGGNY